MQTSGAEAQKLLDNLMSLEEYVPGAPILKIGFGYPGNKSEQLDFILPHLPQSDIRVDVFGGSGAILLNSPESPLEIFNDRCSGVTAFYRCVRDRERCDKLKERIDGMIYSKDEWHFCKHSWESLVNDEVERAARWFYTIHCSFASKMKEWGRFRTPNGLKMGKFEKFPIHMEKLHRRIQKWQIENDDFSTILKRYDSKNTVFYADPTYFDCTPGMYTHELSKQQHRSLLDLVHTRQGFCAISGYPNDLYDTEYDWDGRYEWKHAKSTRSGIACEENNFQGHDIRDFKMPTTEVLWIKDFS